MSDVYEFIDSCRVTTKSPTAKYAYPVVKMCAWRLIQNAEDNG